MKDMIEINVIVAIKIIIITTSRIIKEEGSSKITTILIKIMEEITIITVIEGIKEEVKIGIKINSKEIKIEGEALIRIDAFD